MKILLLEDHELFASGLIKLIEENFNEVSIHSFSTVTAIKNELSKINQYDLLISDIEIPGEDVFEIIEPVVKTIPVLVLSMHNKLPVINRCKKIGVKGYMLKDDNNIDFAIREVLDGKEYYSTKVKTTLRLLDEFQNDILTPREEEVVKSLAHGKSTNEIADILCVSPNTIASHRKNIYRKLNLNNVAEITKFYYENYI